MAPTADTHYIDYQPRSYQAALHRGFSSTRNAIVIAHRRAGKTVAMVAQLIRDAFECSKPRPRVAYIAPTYRMAKSIAWDYFKAMLQGLRGVRFRESDLQIDLPNGARIMLMGGENPDRLRGQYLDSAAVDEMADCPESLITAVLRPCLADRQGSLYLIGTVKGRNHFWHTYERALTHPDWFTANLKPDDTHALSDDDLRILRDEMGEEFYRAELLNDPTAAVRGAFYGETMRDLEEKGRICEIEHLKDHPITLAFDLGWADATAVWAIQTLSNGSNRLFDYAEYTHVPFSEILSEYRSRSDWQIERWIGPHDLNQHDPEGTSRHDTASNLGIWFEVCPRHLIIDGIEASRRVLQRCWFDAEATRTGREYLSLYRAQWDDKRRVLSRAPVHDECSHAADAFRYFAKSTDGMQPQLWGEIPYNNAGVI